MDEELIINTYFKQAALKAIEATVRQVFATSLQKCPFKTGRLRNSASIISANPAAGQFVVGYNTNDTAPYAELVEKGGTVAGHFRKSRKTGQPYPVQSYDVPGSFYLKDAISETLSGNYNEIVVTANVDSQGFSITL